MKRSGLIPFKGFAVASLVAFSAAVAAQEQTMTDPTSITPGQDMAVPVLTDSEAVAQPKFIVAEDGVHLVRNALSDKNPIHYYGFVALRGQDVLLGLPRGEPEGEAWKVEYIVDGEWHPLNFRNKIFKDLKPGTDVIIRVSSKTGLISDAMPYVITFGSYPVMKKYDLLDEPGVLRIPSGYTEPGWLATQIYKEAELKVEFTDTKGAPLKGGIAVFELSFGKNERKETRTLVSGADGSATERINLGACYGGAEAMEFTDKDRGFNTWNSWYKVGRYYFGNFMLGTAAPRPHVYYLGHICTQKVQRTVAPRG